MAVYTEKKTYHTKAHMGMIDVTEDFQHAVEEACRQHGISAGTVTGFTTGGVAGLKVMHVSCRISITTTISRKC